MEVERTRPKRKKKAKSSELCGSAKFYLFSISFIDQCFCCVENTGVSAESEQGEVSYVLCCVHAAGQLIILLRSSVGRSH